MNKQLEQELRARLESMERDLTANLNEQNTEYQDLSTNERLEPVDEAQVRMDSHTRGAMRFHDEERLTQIRSAIQRMNEGIYGTCAACGGPIADERLKAKPEAMLCIACERRHESQGAGTR